MVRRLPLNLISSRSISMFTDLPFSFPRIIILLRLLVRPIVIIQSTLHRLKHLKVHCIGFSIPRIRILSHHQDTSSEDSIPNRTPDNPIIYIPVHLPVSNPSYSLMYICNWVSFLRKKHPSFYSDTVRGRRTALISALEITFFNHLPVFPIWFYIHRRTWDDLVFDYSVTRLQVYRHR